MINFLTGAIAMASVVIALFFLRFWYGTRQRLFLYFALSFAVEAGHRVYAAWDSAVQEDSPYHYLLRLLSYGLILWAILEQNLAPHKNGKKP